MLILGLDTPGLVNIPVITLYISHRLLWSKVLETIQFRLCVDSDRQVSVVQSLQLADRRRISLL